MSPLYVILGLLAGVLAGLFGIGGGVVMVIGMVSSLCGSSLLDDTQAVVGIFLLIV